nr:transposase [Verminephrobacter aporrectodeae]
MRSRLAPSWGLELGRRYRFEPFKKLASSLKESFNAVVRGTLEHCSNAYVEAVNGLLQQAKCATLGYRTSNNFITIAHVHVQTQASTDQPVGRT